MSSQAPPPRQRWKDSVCASVRPSSPHTQAEVQSWSCIMCSLRGQTSQKDDIFHLSPPVIKRVTRCKQGRGRNEGKLHVERSGGVRGPKALTRLKPNARPYGPASSRAPQLMEISRGRGPTRRRDISRGPNSSGVTRRRCLAEGDSQRRARTDASSEQLRARRRPRLKRGPPPAGGTATAARALA